MERILSINFFAGIPSMSFPQQFLMKKLEEKTTDVLNLSCRGVLYRSCPVVSSVGKMSATIEEKQKICSWCKNYSREIGRLHKNGIEYIDDYISDESIKKVIDLVDALSLSEYASFEYSGYEVGRISSYCLMIKNKLIDLNNLTNDVFAQWKNYLINTLITLVAYENFVRRQPKFQKVIIGDNQYEINHIIKEINNELGIDTVCMMYGFHSQNGRDHLMFTRKDGLSQYLQANDFYKTVQYFPNESEINLGLEHVYGLLGKKNSRVYSEAYSARKKRSILDQLFGLNVVNESSKNILLTTGSLDELYAYDLAIQKKECLTNCEFVFDTQEQWILETIQFISNCENVNLIIRVHPRELIGSKSDTVVFLEGLRDQLPKNVSLNFPSDSISIYDLFTFIDLCLFSTSSVGIEAGLMGVPVLPVMTGMTYFPEDLTIETNLNKSCYFDRLRSLVNNSIDFKEQTIENSIVWLSWILKSLYIHIDSSCYWNIFPKEDGIQKYLKKKRIKYNLPVFRLKDYFQMCSFSREDFQVVLEMLGSSQEVHEIKNKVNSNVRGKELLKGYLEKLNEFDLCVNHG